MNSVTTMLGNVPFLLLLLCLFEQLRIILAHPEWKHSVERVRRFALPNKMVSVKMHMNRDYTISAVCLLYILLGVSFDCLFSSFSFLLGLKNQLNQINRPQEHIFMLLLPEYFAYSYMTLEYLPILWILRGFISMNMTSIELHVSCNFKNAI